MTRQTGKGKEQKEPTAAISVTASPKQLWESNTLRNGWAAESCGQQSSLGSQAPTASVSWAVSASPPLSVLQQLSCLCPLLHSWWLSSSTLVPAPHQAASQFSLLRGMLVWDTAFQYLKPICTCLHKFNWLYFVQERTESSCLPSVV